MLEVNETLDNRGEFNNQTSIQMMGGYDPLTGIPTATKLNNSGVFNHSGGISSYETFYETLSLVNSGTFENNGMFNVSNGLSITNSGKFNNNADLFGVGYLENSSTFENNSALSVSGDLVNTSTGVFNNVLGWMLEVNGTLDNRGEFNNQTNVQMMDGYDPLTGMAIDATIYNSGVFNNDGGIFAHSFDGLYLNNTGEFNHLGQLDVVGALILNNSGTFNNGQVNSFLSPSPLMLGMDSVINNYGVFNNYRGVDGSFGTNSALTNTGTMNNYPYIAGIQQVVNSGTINNSDQIDIQYMQTLVNMKSGIINNDVSFGSRIYSNGNLENRGTINNTEGAIIDLGYESNTKMKV